MSIHHDPHSLNLNFYSGNFKKRAYPIYAELRENYPVYPIQMPTGLTAWVFTRYEDCIKLSTDKRNVRNPKNVPGMGTYQDIMQDEMIEKVIYNSMLSSDPPDHTRLRKLVHKAFTPKMIQDLRGDIQELTDELLDQIQDQHEIDLIETFAHPLPIIVICSMLGIPKEDRQLFKRWSKIFVEAQNDPSKFTEVSKMVHEFTTYIKEVFAARRKNPQDDLVTALVQAEDDGDQLSESELFSTVFLLLVAGHETTVNLISNGTLALLENPDQMATLQEQPELVSTAIEEFLRYYSPVEVNPDRFATEDFTIHGQEIKAGDMLIIVHSAANRDPRQFDNPDQLDITRDPNPHIAFGHGIHYCLGAPLARLEGQIAFTTLLRRLPDIQLNIDPQDLQYADTYLMRGLQTLPVRF